MKIGLKLLSIALLSCALTTASYAATKTQDCFSYLKAQDYTRAIQAGNQAARENSSDGDAFYCLAVAAHRSGDFDNSLRSLQRAESLFTKKTDLQVTYSLLGIIFEHKGDLQQALNYHSRALGLARDMNDKDGEASALNNLSSVVGDRGDTAKAIDYLQQALKIQPNEGSKATYYNNLATRLSASGRNEEALEYLQKSVDIHRRIGDYHKAARSLLNKGAIQTQLGQYEAAEATISEGMAAIKKVGDKYWESVAFEYLGDLAVAREKYDLAAKHYQEALNLARAAGATTQAEKLARTLAAQQKNAASLSYGVVEIGSKGVKAAVVTSTRDAKGRVQYEAGFKKSINTGIIEGVVERGEFSAEAIDETTKAVIQLIAGIKASSPNLGDNITIAGSSALSVAINRSDLAGKIKAQTGIEPIFINSAQELSYAILGSTSNDLSYKTALLDIGSGNGRIGYLISPKGGKPAGQAVLDMRAGSVTLAELANKAKAPGEDYVTALNRVVTKEIEPKIVAELKQYPIIRRHTYFMTVGGAAWAMSTLLHPENQGEYVQLSKSDFQDYYRRISLNPSALLEQDLSSIADEKVREKARKQIAAVKSVFNLENLQAGARLLKMIGDADPFGAADIYFSRDGNWSYGLAEAQALVKKQGK